MRQFRSSTDAVFDVDTVVETAQDLTLVTQGGPPPQEAAET